MGGSQNNGDNFTIDVSDLSASSQLQSLAGQAKPLFTFGKEIAQYLMKPISATPNGAATSITVSGSGNWNAGSIGFALSASAKCQLKIATKGAILTYAPDLESAATAKFPASDYAGFAYVVIGLDFDISRNISGSGSAGSVGISGKISGSSDTSITFCHQVASTMKLADALVETFNAFVFPFHPRCALDMQAGDLAQVNFTGCLGCSFTASYGFTSVKFSAPGTASVIESVTKNAASLKLPSGKIEIGASATLAYSHTDCFTAMVQKQDASTAFLYILRANKSDLSAGVEISAALTFTSETSLTVDSQKIQSAVNGIIGMGGDQAAQVAPQIANGLTSKLDNWVQNAVAGSSLALTWDKQLCASMLFKYAVNLADPARLSGSWKQLCAGDLIGAASAGGLVPEAGSGISNQLNKSFTVGLQFFNLFKATSITTYFQKTYVTITETGDICYMFDIGQESEQDVRKAKKTCIVHFVGTFDQSRAISKADVELVIELTATNSAKEAARIASLPNFMPTSDAVAAAKAAMGRFAAASASSGTLKLVCSFQPPAYAKLNCSAFSGTTPPPDQTLDGRNWQAFHDAVVTFPDLQWTSVFKYSDWQRFNRTCRTQAGFPAPPVANRRVPGNRQAITPGFWDGTSAQNVTLIGYFLSSSADFMNLCEDLHALAGLTEVANDADGDAKSYDAVLLSLVNLIVKNDVNTDYAQSSLAALLHLLSSRTLSGKATSAKSSLTCTFTIS